MVDIRMFGVRERISQIEKIKATLGLTDDKVIIDEKHAGVIPTAKRAWSIPTDASHVLVLQDDVEVCHDFKFYCETICGNFPDAIFGLFPFQFRTADYLRRWPKSPYVTSADLSGAGIIMPTKYIKPCLEAWKDEISGDDVNIRDWAVDNGIMILTTIPALIQHIGFVSVFNPKRSIGMTEFFWDPAKADWNNTFVEPWTNIVRG